MKKTLEKSEGFQVIGELASFCKTRRAFIYSLLLSTVLHIPVLITREQWETLGEMIDQIDVVREKTEIFLKQPFRLFSRNITLARLKDQPADKVELGNFFLETEFNEGLTDDEEKAQKGKEKFDQLTDSFKKLAEKETDKLKVLGELTQKQGTHMDGKSSLNSLLVDGKGNCEARAKLAVSVLQKTYPDMPVKLQHYRDHIRAIANVDGQWYAIEGGAPKPIEKKDLQGTVVTDPSIFVSSYTGKNSDVNKIGLKPNPDRRKVIITDTYFNLLPGVDKGNLADYAKGPALKPEAPGETLPTAAKAKFAIKSSALKKPENRRFGKKNDQFVKIRIFTDKEVKDLLNKDKKKKDLKPFKWSEEIIVSTAQKKSFEGNDTDLNDLSLLKGMPLEHINLNNTSVADLTPLNGMPLKSVWLTNTPVTDLSPLAGDRFLKVIDLTGTDVSDLTPIARSMSLGRIDLDSTKVKDLNSLRGIPVRLIDISNTEITDLSPLKGTLTIERIFLNDTKVSDLSPLRGMPLKNISLSGTNVFDLSPLRGMPIESIDLSYTDISDLSPLKGMPITNINLSHTNVTDLSPLEGMPLYYVDVSNTNVSDLSPLLRRPVLASLNIKGTKVNSLGILLGKRIHRFYSDLSPQTRWP